MIPIPSSIQSTRASTQFTVANETAFLKPHLCQPWQTQICLSERKAKNEQAWSRLTKCLEVEGSTCSELIWHFLCEETGIRNETVQRWDDKDTSKRLSRYS